MDANADFGGFVESEGGGFAMALISRPGDNNDLVRVLQARSNHAVKILTLAQTTSSLRY